MPRHFAHSALARAFVVSLTFGAALAALPADAAEEPSFQAGVAKLTITPQSPMWLSGYASRDHAAEGTLHDLWAKCLALRDASGHTLLLITLDLVGIDRETSQTIVGRVAQQHGLPREAIALACSHTHTGPVVGQNLRSMYFLNDEQSALVDAYTAWCIDRAVEVAGAALATLEPADLAHGQGYATFATNRRNNPEPEVPQRRATNGLAGPVDHDVPVLTVRKPSGELRAVVCGYACHSTTLSIYQWSGDYPGFAQIALEAAHPGAIALFWAGCGADQNPIPRQTVDLAREYGQQLARAVDLVLAAPMPRLAGSLSARYEEIPLAFAHYPSDDELRHEAAGSDKYPAARAKLLLARAGQGNPLPREYPYPVQVWRLGNDLLWVLLGGEVVVDYSMRLKAELGSGRGRPQAIEIDLGPPPTPQRVWVTGYANDVMAYIPSRRVLAEGGYEGAGAMVYYGLPSPWTPAVETQIVDAVHRLAAPKAQ